MGARASVILTQKGSPKSPVLCQHWGGTAFHEDVRKWILSLYAEDHSKDGMNPWNRLEPGRVFVRLVQKFGTDGYVERERKNVDDSDYGCLYVELGKDEPTFSI